ncbi:MAG: cell division protein SepF [Clostridia bacterium]|nr:cell division protein SepF [Clostridia bacterium]
MGVFDFFGRSPRSKEIKTTKPFASVAPATENTAQNTGPVAVFEPTSYKDVEKMINSFKEGKNTVVHLENLKKESALRVLDMLSGAIYALGGGVYEMGDNVFMFSPSGIEIL